MDRNQVIGLVLISVMFFTYITFFSTPPTVPDQRITDETTTAAPPTPDTEVPGDTLGDERARQKYGVLYPAATGTEQRTVLENQELQVTFNSKGAIVESVLLKKYQDDNGNPLFLITPDNTELSILAQTASGEVDLTELYYTTEQSRQGDSTILNFNIDLGDGRYVSQQYIFPAKGYQIGYNLGIIGLDGHFRKDSLNFNWMTRLPHIEHDIMDSRRRSNITFYSDGFDRLPESTSGEERERVNAPIQWAALKHKFFLSAIIADNPFERADFQTFAPEESDTSYVKRLYAGMRISGANVIGQTGRYKYFFGPNHFQTLRRADAEDFHKNVDLGWPVINWINRFIVVPSFNFLDGVFGDTKWKYGYIIIILGILVKIILFPLNYKSYLAMAKMKVMKPELDALKEKYGDDMQKIQSEQMALYSKVGINPLSGCIPLLLSMPVLLAMFSFFPNSIELRHESFLWATDLSTYDDPIRLPFSIPFYGAHVSIFTLLMTLSTIGMTHFNNQMNTAAGPMKSLSYIMPVVFMFVLNSFPAGLSFYYLVSNLLTIGQQAIIKRFVDEDKIKATLEENRKKNAAGGAGKKSKWMQRVEDAMKMQEQLKQQQQQQKKGPNKGKGDGKK